VTVETRQDRATGADFVAGTRTVIVPAGATSVPLPIAIKGDLLPEGPETMFVHILSASYAGSPATILRSDGIGTINDDDPVAPRITISNATATEGDPGAAGTLAVGISIDSTQKAPVGVSVETRSGTANGSDYTSGAQSVTIAPGARSATLSIPLRADIIGEPQETMTAHITGARLVGIDPRDASVGINRYDGIGTINDDDPAAPVWTVSNASVLEGDPGSANVLQFIVDIDRAQKKAVSIPYRTITGGTAQAADFLAVSGSALIPAGSRRVVVEVPVVGDIAVEGDETVFLNISSPVLGRVNRNTGTGTIKDDDAFPTVSILDGQGAEGTEFDGTAPFVVRLDRPSAAAVEVDFATLLTGKVAGAASGSDVTMVTGTVTFAPGETERIINVTLHADSLIEVDEHFTVQLTGVRGAKLGDRTATGLVGNDDGTGPETAT
jgi:chitinase